MKLGQLSLQSIDFLNSAQKRITYQQRNKIQKRFYIHKIQITQHSTQRLKKKVYGFRVVVLIKQM